MPENLKPDTKTGRKAIFIFASACLVALPLLFFIQSLKNSGVASSLVPGTTEARKIFTELHRNIYETFNEKNESLAYDRLAKTVDEPLLIHVYQEIYDHFMSRQKGGPSLEIMGINIRSFEKLKSPGTKDGVEVRFRVKATWDVLSTVTHEKHWHVRSNNFKAVYTLGLINGDWKIMHDEILWQRRIPIDLSSFKS